VAKERRPCHIYKLDLSNQIFHHSDNTEMLWWLLFLELWKNSCFCYRGCLSKIFWRFVCWRKNLRLASWSWIYYLWKLRFCEYGLGTGHRGIKLARFDKRRTKVKTIPDFQAQMAIKYIIPIFKRDQIRNSKIDPRFKCI